MMVCQLSLSACRTSFLGAYSDMTIGLHKVSRISPLPNHPSTSVLTHRHKGFETNLCFTLNVPDISDYLQTYSMSYFQWTLPFRLKGDSTIDCHYPLQVETGQLLFRLEPPRPSVEPVKGWNPFNVGWLDQSHVWVAWKNYEDTALPYSICILDIVSEEKPVFFEKISWDGSATNWNSLMLQTRHGLLFIGSWWEEGKMLTFGTFVYDTVSGWV